MPLGTEVGLGPGDCVRWGHSYRQKRGTRTPRIFGPCLLWPSQTAGWMKTPLDTEVDLGTGHIVLEVVPAVRERSAQLMSIVAKVAHLS